MSQKVQPFAQRDFSRGVYSDVNTFIAPPNSVRHSLNFVFDEEYGAAKVRQGSTIIGTQLVSENNSALGMHNFRDRDGGNHALLLAVNEALDGTSSIYTTGAGQGAVYTSGTPDLTYQFETYLDEVVFQNGTDAPQAWNGTGNFGASSKLGTASMPTGVDIKNFKDRLWVLTAQGVLHGSGIPAATAYDTISWTSGNIRIPIDPDATAYTGLGVGLARVSGLLLILKERALYTYNGSTTQADFLYDVGCSSVRSIATGGGNVFFFNPDGIWVTRGSQPVRLSRPVQAYIDGMSSSNYGSVAGHANGRYYWCSIGDVTIGLTTYSNVVLRYTIATQEWAVLSYATRPTAFSQYINGTDVTVAYGDDTARAYTLDSGTTDNTTAIPYELITHSLEFGSLGVQKDIHDKLMFYSKNSDDMEIQINVNETDFEAVGTALKRVEDIPINIPLSGNSVELRVVGSSSGEPPVIKGYEFPSVTATSYGAQ